jgi:DNA invertase Pin-like site-specific DNA recombinase
MNSVLPGATVALYCRSSLVGNPDLDVQREVALAYALELGFAAGDVQSFQDTTSGNSRRPGLQQLLAAVTAGKIKVIICGSVTRLTRSLNHLLSLQTRLQRIRLIFLQQQAAAPVSELTRDLQMSQNEVPPEQS